MTLRRISQGVEYTFLFLLMAGPPAFRERDPLATVEGSFDLTVAVKALVWVLASLWIAWHLGRRSTVKHLMMTFPVPPISVLIVLGVSVLLGISIVNSPAPMFSLFRAYQVAAGVVVAWLLVRDYGVPWTLSFLRTCLASLCYMVFFAYLLQPSLVIADNEDFFGIRGDAVAPAGPVGLLLFALVLSWPFEAGIRTRQGIDSLVRPGPAPPLPRWAVRWFFEQRWLLFLLSTSLIVLSRRRVAMALAAGLVILAIGVASRTWPLVGKLAVIVLSAGGLLFAWQRWGDVVSWVVRNPRQLSDLSGRFPLWGGLVDRTLTEGPLLGLGYVAGTRVASLEINRVLGNAHSSFVEVLAGGGLVVAFLYVLMWGIVGSRSAVAGLRADRVGLALLFTCLSLAGYALVTSFCVLPGPVSFALWLLVGITSSGSLLTGQSQRLSRSTEPST